MLITDSADNFRYKSYNQSVPSVNLNIEKKNFWDAIT